MEGHQAWIVGIVEDGEGTATVIERPRIIEVVTGDDGSVQVINNQSSICHLSIHILSVSLTCKDNELVFCIRLILNCYFYNQIKELAQNFAKKQQSGDH